MYELIEKFAAINEQTGEQVEVSHYLEVKQEKTGRVVITINNHLYETNRGDVLGGTEYKGIYVCGRGEDQQIFRVLES